MAGWRVDRQLRQVTERLRELRGELVYVNEQLEVLSDEAESEAIRALVAETPESTFAANDTRKHADAMRKYRDRLVSQIAELESRQDDLLDRRAR
jgi:predicted  nucleic acid-binding Zn-ribbon protein